MKKIAVVFVLVVLCGCAAKAPEPCPDCKPKPKPSPPAAKQKFVYVSRVGCGPCQKMEATLADGGVATALSKYEVIKLDKDKDRDLIKKHVSFIPSYPAYAVIGIDNKLVIKGMGYKSPGDFLKWLESR